MKNTIQDLIELLQKIEDKTQVVYLEGCDCSGQWNGEFDEKYVLLRREKYEY